MSEIRTENLTKKFGSVVAVDELSITFPRGKITCLLGPSGCGKTTLLRMIAGLEQPSGGRVFFGDKEVTHLPPRKREIGMVFQYPVVYRGISVRQNIELPLKARKLPADECAQRVEEVLDILDLTGQADMLQQDLDNVTRQKVSVARAVAYRPDIILFDEPMTNIDANAKIQFKHAFKSLTKKLNQVIIYVTHDQTEAMTFADQIALMENGRIVQCDHPRTLYSEPEDVFGGWFLGNPGMNFVPAMCERQGELLLVQSKLLGRRLVYDGPLEGVEATVGVRPEHIRLTAQAGAETVEATVKRKSISIGGQYLFTLDVQGLEVKAKTSAQKGRDIQGKQVWLDIPLSQVRLFDAKDQRMHGSLSAAQ